MLKPNKTFEERNFDAEVNKVKYGKGGNTETRFEPVCVFSEEKTKALGFIPRFWRGRRNLIFFVENCVKAIKFKETTEEIQAFWTQKEAKEVVKKEIAKSLIKHKPMTWGQFIILLIPIGIILAFVLAIAMRTGVI